jgi:arylsulfatase A-like enzyme
LFRPNWARVITSTPILVAVIGCAGGQDPVPQKNWKKTEKSIESKAANVTSTSEPGTGLADRPNVLLVVLDTLRADCLSAYGGAPDVMPELNRFASRSVVYEHAVSPGGWTLPSHASMFTGLSQTEHGVGHHREVLADSYVTLAELLSDSGYQTAGFACNHWLVEKTGLTQGFEDWWTVLDRRSVVLKQMKGESPDSAAIAPDDDLLVDKGAAAMGIAIRDWLQEKRDSSRPFFIFLNYFEPHQPYKPPKRFFDDVFSEREIQSMDETHLRLHHQIERFIGSGNHKLNDEDIDFIRRLYTAEVRYLDERVGRLLGFLADQGLLDDTIVAITSDHGEHLGEHGMLDHQNSLYEPIVRVPLIVAYPGVYPKGRRIDRPVQTSDLFWTILNRCRLEVQSPPGLPYRDLSAFEEMDSWSPIAVAEFGHAAWGPVEYDGGSRWTGSVQLRAIYRDGWKLIRSNEPSVELYRLGSDASESPNLREDRPDRRSFLEEHLDNWIGDAMTRGKLIRPDDPVEADSLPEETKQALQELGYLR